MPSLHRLSRAAATALAREESVARHANTLIHMAQSRSGKLRVRDLMLSRRVCMGGRTEMKIYLRDTSSVSWSECWNSGSQTKRERERQRDKVNFPKNIILGEAKVTSQREMSPGGEFTTCQSALQSRLRLSRSWVRGLLRYLSVTAYLNSTLTLGP